MSHWFKGGSLKYKNRYFKSNMNVRNQNSVNINDVYDLNVNTDCKFLYTKINKCVNVIILQNKKRKR